MKIKRILFSSIVAVLLVTVGIGTVSAQGGPPGGQPGGQPPASGDQVTPPGGSPPAGDVQPPSDQTTPPDGTPPEGQPPAGEGQPPIGDQTTPPEGQPPAGEGQQPAPGDQTTPPEGQPPNNQGNMGRNPGQNQYGWQSTWYTTSTTTTTTTTDLADDAVDALEDSWIEAQVTYDLYQEIIDQFGSISPFVAIQQALASHIAALEYAFSSYDLDLPDDPSSTDLTFSSLEEACSIAVADELSNIAEYDSWLDDVSDYPDLVQLFTNIRNRAEYSHLPAFQSCAG